MQGPFAVPTEWAKAGKLRGQSGDRKNRSYNMIIRRGELAARPGPLDRQSKTGPTNCFSPATRSRRARATPGLRRFQRCWDSGRTSSAAPRRPCGHRAASGARAAAGRGRRDTGLQCPVRQARAWGCRQDGGRGSGRGRARQASRGPTRPKAGRAPGRRKGEAVHQPIDLSARCGDASSRRPAIHHGPARPEHQQHYRDELVSRFNRLLDAVSDGFARLSRVPSKPRQPAVAASFVAWLPERCGEVVRADHRVRYHAAQMVDPPLGTP